MWSILYFLRNNPEKIVWSLKQRDLPVSFVDKAIELDTSWRKKISELQKLKHEHNVLSRQIPKVTGEEREEKIREARDLLDTIKSLENEVKKLEKERDEALLKIPNILHEEVPVGKDETENVPIRFYGKHKVWKEHLQNFLKETKGFKVDYEIVEGKPVGHADEFNYLGCGDTQKASEVAGSRFYYLFDDLVWLDLSLLLYGLDFMSSKGFKVVIPPYMLRRNAYEGVVALEDFETAIYKVENEDLFLIATSEHPLAALHMNDLINETDLPLLYTGVSPCFRKEAGAHGKETKGIFRVHQFHKIEQFVFCLPEESWSWHEKLINNAEELWRGLNIPFRVVNICTGELGAVAEKKYELETWMPAQGKYKEMVSCSNCTDYQSYRLKIRYITKKGEKGYVHTLNSTAIASTRAITAILENCQDEEGNVIIPKVLRKYLEPFNKAPKEVITPCKRGD